MITKPGTKVYVSWYGRTLEGEVADGEGFMGMTPVRIPLDGHHPVALFFPQHVYDSPELLTGISKDQSKVDENLTEISEKQSKVSPNDILPADDRIQLETFKRDNWDHEHGHLRTDKLDEFYLMWREMMRPFGFVDKAEAPAITCHYPAITQGYSEITPGYSQEPFRAVPRNGTPPNRKKMRCWRCEHLDYDHINGKQEQRLPGEHYCGLHGMARVDPDGPQQNLDHKGGCGFTARKKAVQLSLFD